jgi:zinc protease
MKPLRRYKDMFEYELPNGLKVIFVLRDGLNVVTSNVTYLVGSRNEGLGKTGSTHFLEHGMFRGSENFHGDNGMWVLEQKGAYMNATTYTDRTNYFEVIQTEHLDDVIPREADRMRSPLLDEDALKTEMTVVRNEYERGENNDYEVLQKRIVATAFMAHPYGHSTIGWKSDIENVSASALKEFHDKYYIPNNAVYTVVGNFDPVVVSKMITEHFGKIPAGKPVPKMYTDEPIQTGQRRVLVKRPSKTSLMGIAFKCVHGLHKDAVAFSVLQHILGTPKTNPFEPLKTKGIVHDVMPSFERMRDPYLFQIWVTTNRATEASLSEAEEAVFKTLHSFEVQDKHVEQAKKAIKNKWDQELESTRSMAMAINEAIARGDAFDVFNRFDMLQKVSASDIKNAIKTLTLDVSTVGWFLPADSPPQKISTKSYSPGVYPMAPKIYELQTRDPHVLNFKDQTISCKNGLFTKYPTNKTFIKMTLERNMEHTAENHVLKLLMADLMTKGVMLKNSAFSEENIQNFFTNNDISRTIVPGAYGIHLISETSSKNTQIVSKLAHLLHGELHTPTLSSDEFSYLKRKICAEIAGRSSDVNEMASTLFSKQLFSKKDPNYKFYADELMMALNQVTHRSLKDYHDNIIQGSIKVSVVSSIPDSFKTFTTMPRESSTVYSLQKNDVVRKINKHIDGKSSCTVKWGHIVDVKSLPLKLGINALGGGFTARLMKIVRDQHGLTYGINSQLIPLQSEGSIFCVGATFAPSKLKEGLELSEEIIKTWAENGITQNELNIQKEELEGSFDVQFDNACNVSKKIHNQLLHNQPVETLDRFKEVVDKVTLAEVNSAIKELVDLKKLTRVVVGSIKGLDL